MATIPKRLLTVCLALAFFIGATVQVLPWSMAIGEMGVRADMGAPGLNRLAPAICRTVSIMSAA
jgi:hypothetical protein